MTCESCGAPLHWTGESGTTLVGYHSRDGHIHDDNCVFRRYECERGHSRQYSRRASCPICDWRGKSECFCHQGQKLDKWPDEGTA